MSTKVFQDRIIHTFRSSLLAVGTLLLIANSIYAQNLPIENISDDIETESATDTETSAALIAKLPASSLQSQRIEYTKAMTALNKGQKSDFKKHLANLDNYPLKPYAEYSELKRRLYLFPYQDIDNFLDNNENSALGDQLAKNWLLKLAQQKHWHDYQTYFESTTIGKNNAELSCYYLLSKFNTGEESALEKVEPLWNVGKSQPKACDPIFKKWVSAGYLTPQIAWERFSKAIAKKNRMLARYVAKQMPAPMQELAALYLEVDRHPKQLKNHQRFRQQSPEMHEIILHGLKRYARRSPEEALTEWERYNASHYFPSEQLDDTREYLIAQLAKGGHIDEAQKLLAKTSKVANQELTAWLARDALKSQDWQRLYNSLSLFSNEEQESQRWLYWRARAMEELNINDPSYPNPETIYSSLALTRSFYGFMSADKIGREYTLVDRPVASPNALLLKVANEPSMLRARELLVLGSLNNARREWWYATRNLETTELLAAGQLAEQWGWHKKSIQSLIQAQYWDALQLRFPLAYEEEVRFAAKETKIDPTLLFAIARQESAFAADARSPAGAMGLMQLMPATAKQTAKKFGVAHNTWDLINPSHNINLGSRYLDELLQLFDGNRILAAAAYNAGPNRVKRWLKDSGPEMPYDVWIETIPFRETRGYVQNVLSYSVIYSYRMGQQSSLLTKKEAHLPSLGL